MSDAHPRLVVFVHGWSVTHTDTYGGLPERLVAEAKAAGLSLTVRQIWLGRYISFHDEVRLRDISHAFEDAVERELRGEIERYGRFACITHSTGGPAIRDWWWRHYLSRSNSGQCPMSHLVMLAPANFGSTLAQLGKSRVGRLKSWFQGVEPGQGVLDWLELGSPEAWALNDAWIDYGMDAGDSAITARGVFPFVLTGQAIDRKFYDNLNTYTGETGSDGVVRAAAANLNCTRVRLHQSPVRKDSDGRYSADELRLHGGTQAVHAPETAFRLIAGASHSGKDMGIMRNVSAQVGARKGAEAVTAILDCLRVGGRQDYLALCRRFTDETAQVQDAERVEVEKRLLLADNIFVHDRYSMVIFRVRDEAGHAVEDFDLLLTAGSEDDPNHLPRGFALDRQANKRARGTITYYFNWDVMTGCEEVRYKDRVLRLASPGAQGLGLRIEPRPTDGFVHYLPCGIRASTKLLKNILLPNRTTLVDITLRRVVRRGVFGLDQGVRQKTFKKTPPGEPIHQPAE